MNTADGWQEAGDALVRSYRFAGFGQAFAFLTRVAFHAEKLDHHPEFTSRWNRVDFRLTTHDAGGITDQDVALAAEIDRLAAEHGGHQLPLPSGVKPAKPIKHFR